MRDASFFAFASKSLAPAFTHAFKRDSDLSPYAHLPFLACLLHTQSPTEAVFLNSSRSLSEWAAELVASESLPTSVHATDAEGETPPSWDKIALLHIDATTPASLIEERLDRWTPRLREDGTLLIYGVETPRDAALWRRLSAESASFLLTGGPGLGLLAPRSIPATLTCLLGAPGQRLGDGALARLKYHFSTLGETAADRAGRDSAIAVAQARENAARDARIRLSEMTAALRASQKREDVANEANASLLAQLRETQTAASRLDAKLADVEARLARNTDALERTRRQAAEQQELLGPVRIWMEQAFSLLTSQSTATAAFSQRLSSHEEALTTLRSFLEAPAGVVRRFARAVLRPNFSPFVPTTPEAPRLTSCAPPPVLPVWRDEPLPPEITPASPAPETLDTGILIEAPSSAQRLVPASARRRNILFVSGEPTTPGTIYRCQRNAAACATTGHVTRVCDCAAVGPDEVAWADVLILWRVVYSEHVNILIRLAHERGAIVVFDVDDLVFIPALANISVIDGIRTIGVTESETNSLFAGFGVTLSRSDACIGTTDTLAHHMRRLKPLTYTLPNIFDHACLAKSRLAVRQRAWEGTDGLIRIGYASGTRTHQRDFALVADVLARLLYQRPELRLVLFREPGNHKPILLMDEFPALAPVAAQIEWRDTVPLVDLPKEFARFDISIAPLETGNVFCEAKSEIKFLEAALAGVPSVVSPTAPYRAAIIEGVTGLTADTPDEWDRALRRLLDDASLRSRMARDAFNHLLWNFGPERQALLFETLIMSLGDEVEAARATETILARGSYRSRNLPEIPESQTLFIHDALGEAQVTVLITSHNYGDLIVEALESVRAQTMRTLDLIVVDDASDDDSAAVVLQWARRHADRFNRLLVLAPHRNVGLGGARNIGVSASETPFFLSLDADNRLLPNACAALLEACADAAYAYPSIRTFGEGHSPKIMGDLASRPLRLAGENYIDAMAMVAKWAWAAAGGYYVSREAMGWEDFDLWCSLAEMGLRGTRLAHVVAEYRMHDASMTTSVTERGAHKARVVAHIKARHPWVDVHHEAISRA